MSIASMAPASVVTSAQRQPFQFGLFSVVTPRTSGDRWEAGVQPEPETCEPVGGIGPYSCDEDSPTVGLPKDLDPNLDSGEAALPFLLYGHFTCSPVGYTLQTAQDKAEEHLTTREEAGAEHAFWTGDLGNTPSLASADTEVLSTAALAPLPAVAALENWLATEYGSVGVIHVSRGAALVLVKEGGVEVKGGRLQTVLGTPVVAGAGYPGTGPTGQDVEGTEWIYASPSLYAYRGDVETSSAIPGDLMDRARNNLHAIAERQYLIGFGPCGVAAVEVTINNTVNPA